MKFSTLILSLVLAGLPGSTTSKLSAAESSLESVRPFLDRHCYKCHGEKKQKGDLRLDTATFDLSKADGLERWQNVLDRLRDGEMPPKSEDRPPKAEMMAVTGWLAKQVEAAAPKITTAGNETMLRRLNLREYRLTLRDLLGLNIAIFNPTLGFPDDETTDGFDNNGKTLVTSGFLLEHYLRAAEAAVEKACAPTTKPEVKKISLKAPFDREKTQMAIAERKLKLPYQQLWEGNRVVGPLVLDDLPQGVPHDGYYRVRVKACALDRQHPYDRELIGTDVTEPLRLGIIAASARPGSSRKNQPGDAGVATLRLPDDKPEWLEARVWLDKGCQPRLAYLNGPDFFKPIARLLPKRHPEMFKSAVQKPGNRGLPWTSAVTAAHTPRIRLFEMEIEGPLYDQWPLPSYQAVFAGREFAPERTRELLARFMARAFRRPLREGELERLAKFVDERGKAGDVPLEAFKAGLKAVLCSPAFLYREEPPGRLNDHALATRLSYFFWSTMPDEHLLDLATHGELSKPAVLADEVQRLLRDPKSAAFVNHFTDRWLRLYRLGEMPPDTKAFREYYVHRLQGAMRTETHMFFADLLHNNRDLGLLLNADYTFVNRDLARHYGIANVNGDGFERVALTDPRRGGLLGQAAVLTVTANGVDTSPVTRGVWILENIFGTPPKPPPPGVPALEPDVRGATTIREQLAKHRTSETCASCHHKIDPPGFALENFDAIGGWRIAYDDKGALKVDASGTTPDGGEFRDIVGFKKLLAEHKDQFTRCLTEKLLTYATGRRLTIADRRHVDEITRQAREASYGLADLVSLVVRSEAFQSK